MKQAHLFNVDTRRGYLAYVKREIKGGRWRMWMWKNELVITFGFIDHVHEHKGARARQNFHANKARFMEGKDYFLLKGEELKRFRVSFNLTHEIGSLTLLTESGYAMLVKTFHSDIAWQIQRELVEVYFRTRFKARKEIVRRKESLLNLPRQVKQLTLRIEKIEEDVRHTKDAVMAIGDKNYCPGCRTPSEFRREHGKKKKEKGNLSYS